MHTSIHSGSCPQSHPSPSNTLWFIPSPISLYGSSLMKGRSDGLVTSMAPPLAYQIGNKGDQHQTSQSCSNNDGDNHLVLVHLTLLSYRHNRQSRRLRCANKMTVFFPFNTTLLIWMQHVNVPAGLVNCISDLFQYRVRLHFISSSSLIIHSETSYGCVQLSPAASDFSF